VAAADGPGGAGGIVVVPTGGGKIAAEQLAGRAEQSFSAWQNRPAWHKLTERRPGAAAPADKHNAPPFG
jgi:hypothetical protein